MAETYRTGASQSTAESGARSSSYRTANPDRVVSPDYEDDLWDDDLQDYEYGEWSDRGEHPRTRTGLALDDGIILLGILLGGTAGYMIASSVRTDRVGSQTRRRFRGSEAASQWRRQRQRGSYGSVEHDETTDLIASNKVESTAVYNRRGDKLGEVYNFMVGKRSGQVAYAVMSFGGFLGVGQKYHPLPWNMLTYDTNKKGYVVDVDKEQLMAAPSYGAGEEPFSQPDYGRHVRDYWTSRRTGSSTSV